MKKNGFTLVELLAVIIILAVIALMAFPAILNSIKKSENTIDDSVKKIILNGAKLYLDDNIDDYPKIKGYTYCLPLVTLIESNHLEKGIIEATMVDASKKTVKVTVDDEYVYKIVNNEECQNVDFAKSCFATSENADGSITITDYYDNFDNDVSKETCPKDVIIPSKINDKTVTVIGVNAFSYNKLISITIPDTITTIGNYAFKSNDLTSVIIPNGVTTIGDHAFAANKLTNVIIPNTLTTINDYVFAYNDLIQVNIPSDVKKIGNYAFMDNELASLTIPNSVTTIGKAAFALNKLTGVEIPSSVKYLGGGAFTHNNFPENKEFMYGVNSDGTIDYTTLNSCTRHTKNDMVPSQINGIKLKHIDDYAFAWAFYPDGSNDITIPDSVTTIGEHAFYGAHITNVTIPNSVTTIGEAAFASNQLTNVIIPGSVITIGNQAFEGNKLTNVTIEEGVNTISYAAFGNNQLRRVTIPSSVKEIGCSAFRDNQLTSVTIKGVQSVNKFEHCGPDSSPGMIWGWAPGYGTGNIVWTGQD